MVAELKQLGIEQVDGDLIIDITPSLAKIRLQGGYGMI